MADARTGSSASPRGCSTNTVQRERANGRVRGQDLLAAEIVRGVDLGGPAGPEPASAALT